MGHLVLVESPAKAKTIEKYLGKDYKVTATLGHVIDLPKNKIAVDIENDYEPMFEVMADKKKVINAIKKLIPKEGKVYLAMDPDREGEAIAHHVSQALKLKDPQRITFHEITKDAVVEAISKPGKVDKDLVSAQFARRVLDRLVGYKISQLLWKKMWYGLSAGRVQSVALKLIVEREEEISKFKPEEYWDFKAHFQNNKHKFIAEIRKLGGKKYIPKTEEEVKNLTEDIKGLDGEISNVGKKMVKKNPYPPFTTSTLQQAANNLLGFSSKRTMALAQILYQDGYITYMRTDSVNLSQQAISAIREVIKNKFGKEYVPEKPNYFKNKSRNAQEAHEAIRPSHFDVSSADIEKKYGKTEAKLYDLIYKRSVASQMKQKVSEVLTIEVSLNGRSNKLYTFVASGEKVIFEGFRKIWGGEIVEKGELQTLLDIEKGEKYLCKDVDYLQNFTKPKPRYTEASLVKALETLGVGRPSTYATIISTIIERGYVGREVKNLFPKDVGVLVSHFLEKNFERLVNYQYTAKVEEDLDEIAEGKVKYTPFIDGQYKPLVNELDNADKLKKDEVVIIGKSEEKCPECGADMVVRVGRYGKFLSCSKFPDCKGIKGLNGDVGKTSEQEAVVSIDSLDKNKYVIFEKCPECKSLVELKSGRYGLYWKCTNKEKCGKNLSLLLKEVCPECGKNLVERKGRWGKTFIGCSGYPKCRFIKKQVAKKKVKRRKKVSNK